MSLGITTLSWKMAYFASPNTQICAHSFQRRISVNGMITLGTEYSRKSEITKVDIHVSNYWLFPAMEWRIMIDEMTEKARVRKQYQMRLNGDSTKLILHL
jgi:hypothetical protein